ncbi:uncharacterized protein LOC107489277 [Arachis duranensis]|uniref:Uncharacterized protein LOC107489277 n=1 Tax=Arachis duranensis TaxID=130453 RepID=A0A6P4DJB6_ARADU|nr:uncharacterized protein LOC107489277 [Arachis duranensis]
MAAPRRITFQEAGAPNFTLPPFQAHNPNLGVDIEIKIALINLLPKFHGLPAQEPLKHLRDFQIACSTVRRNGATETSILLAAFPFSLEKKAREWYYTQPKAVVTNWDMLRREFLEKYFPAEVTDRLRKEISMIIQGKSETLYEYSERFTNLLDPCPHHIIDKLVLISYFTQGMKPQDKTTLDCASNGSLKKYKTTDEAWQLIDDLAEYARTHKCNRNNHPKAVAEVSSCNENTALTQSLCEMTNLLKQIHLGQQQSQLPSPQPSQQLVPQRVCGICADYSHYIDECPQLQHEDKTLAATHNFYDCPNQGYYQQGSNYNQGGNFNQGWQDNSNQGWRDNSNQEWRDNYNRGGRDNNKNQRWNNNNRQQN